MNTDYKITIKLEKEIAPAKLGKRIIKGIHSYSIGIIKLHVQRIEENKNFIFFLKLGWEEPPDEIAAIIHNQLLDYEPEIKATLHWLDV